MRLLHTRTLELQEFFPSSAIPHFESSQLNSKAYGSRIPAYAILSHVWGPGEVLFKDITGDRKLLEKKVGFAKVQNSCKQARRDGLKYIWIDSCCIDKSSSTELAEAINSMYQWYRESELCYALLADYNVDDILLYDENDPKKYTIFNPKTMDEKRYEVLTRPLEKPARTSLPLFYTAPGRYSRWFTRGWTLQELLAPANVQFFDTNWTNFGTKEEHMEKISEITKIDLYALNGGDLSRLSISRRMSWAANRQTTRLEDTAYCLLGIFNINMPLLYGEGLNAFIRLQEEILKISDHQSLFAWKDPTMPQYRDDFPNASKPQGLLAASPHVFQFSDRIAQFYSETPGRAVTNSTNKGLQVEFLMCLDPTYPSGLIYLAVLSSHMGTTPGVHPGIRLRRLSPDSEQYARIGMSQLLSFASSDSQSLSTRLQGLHQAKRTRSELTEVTSGTTFFNWTVQSIFVRQKTQFPLPPGFWLVDCSAKDLNFQVREGFPLHSWDPNTQVMQPEPSFAQGTKKLGALFIDMSTQAGSTHLILIFGTTDWEANPWCETILFSYEQCAEVTRFSPNWRRLYLKRVFDGFVTDQVKLPIDTESRTHEFVCEKLGLKSIAEMKNVSGRYMYLLHLLTYP